MKSTLERELKDLKSLRRKLCCPRQVKQSCSVGSVLRDHKRAIPTRLETRAKESGFIASRHIQMCRQNESKLYQQ